MRPAGDAGRRNYLLAVLTTVLAYNYVDRLALNLVLQDIKGDLQLSDTQLGLLTGIAFSLFYSVMGLPIARWVDRGNRVAVLSITIALGSLGVALCGIAASFWQLLLIRIGVAVGEAGCIPPAHSLIAEYFKRGERPRAVSIYMLGGPLSAVGGYLLAGWLNELVGWRLTFMLIGLPGLALAALVQLTLKDPRSAGEVRTEVQLSWIEVLASLRANATFRRLVLVFAVLYFFGYGVSQWTPAFFIRSHGLGTQEIGSAFALIFGLGGFVGTYLGGELASRYAANNEDLQLRSTAIASATFAVLYVCVYLAADARLAFVLMGLAAVGGAAMNGPMFAIIQTVVPARMRGTAIAVVFLVANLVGMGLGPLAVGYLSDTLRPSSGDESLRYALLLLCPGYVWAAWQMWRASQSVARDLPEAERIVNE